jgi:orotate phosphoribosyltransferase
MFIADRADAGRQLAARLKHLRGEPVVVLGLPRGGVPVALEVARALGAPLDVIVVRKRRGQAGAAASRRSLHDRRSFAPGRRTTGPTPGTAAG